MATVFTVETPKDAWGLVSHFLGTYLTPIPWYGGQMPEHHRLVEETGVEECERIILNNRTKLVGAMHMIARNLDRSGHVDDATKVQQLLEMIATQNVTDPTVVEAIFAKHEEFDPSRREFREALDRLNAEHAPKK
jgi:pyruvate-formate lyase-activating enzyme